MQRALLGKSGSEASSQLQGSDSESMCMIKILRGEGVVDGEGGSI